jgi:hypothetical protein
MPDIQEQTVKNQRTYSQKYTLNSDKRKKLKVFPRNRQPFHIASVVGYSPHHPVCGFPFPALFTAHSLFIFN